MAECQRPGTFVLDFIRGPHAICKTNAPDSHDGLGNPTVQMQLQFEIELEELTSRRRHNQDQQLEAEAQKLEDRRRLDECAGQSDLQNLIAERLTRSKRFFP